MPQWECEIMPYHFRPAGCAGRKINQHWICVADSIFPCWTNGLITGKSKLTTKINKAFQRIVTDHHNILQRFTIWNSIFNMFYNFTVIYACLLYTSDAADDLLCVDLGGRRII